MTKLRVMNRKTTTPRSWYRIENKGLQNAAKVYIYDELSEYGVTAQQFVQDLDALGEDTPLDVHLNTPGGNAWDGIAIYNALKAHKGRVTVVVDSLAASAGSIIAMGGDETLITRNGSMMVHNAMGLVLGNAADMREAAGLLDKVSENIADIYSQKSGKSVEDWQQLMDAETWFNAKEAVDAGLANAILGEDSPKKDEMTEGDSEEEPDEDEMTEEDIESLLTALKEAL